MLTGDYQINWMFTYAHNQDMKTLFDTCVFISIFSYQPNKKYAIN
jgi:hypothetical protein